MYGAIRRLGTDKKVFFEEKVVFESYFRGFLIFFEKID
jgi:hypothetical protein